MKTIKELSIEFGISRQALTKKIESMGYKSSLIKLKKGFCIPEKIEYDLRQYYLSVATKCNQMQPKVTESNLVQPEDATKCNQMQPNATKSNLMQPEDATECNRMQPNATKSNLMQPEDATKCNQMQPKVTESNLMQLVDESEAYQTEISKLNDEISNLKEDKIKLTYELQNVRNEIKLLEQTIVELKADKFDLQKHRDNLTTALTVSKSDLSRLENIVTQMAALPLRKRVFGWSGAVAQLTTTNENSAEIIFSEDNVEE